MSQVATAQLKDGQVVKFLTEPKMEGGMKDVYFTADRSAVVCFFKSQGANGDPQRLARLEAVLSKFNPTLDPTTGEYWKRLLCWPTGIVVQPQLGILVPTYAANYYFATGPWQGKEKQCRWFTSPKLSKHLPGAEQGTWRLYLSICILLARAVRRLHVAGLAHSDLSSKNVLIDPTTGQCTIIDIDSLVVPGIFPPDVMGTAGYIAPEVIATQHLATDDPRRIHPSTRTDQHALAVLIYELLLRRHPLEGPKINSTNSAEDDERLSKGQEALFVEHPTDHANRPHGLEPPLEMLGPYLKDLFLRTFVKGLREPGERPGAPEWEKALVRTWDLLVPCPNPRCTQKSFVLHDPVRVRCPFCGAKASGSMPLLKLRAERRPGQWVHDGQIVLTSESRLFPWHVFDNQFPAETADRTPQAYCAFHQGRWLLINERLPSLTSPSGNRVPPGQAVELADGAQIRLSQEPRGRIAEVQLIHA